MLLIKCRVTHGALCWLTFGQLGPRGKHSVCTSAAALCLYFWVARCHSSPISSSRVPQSLLLHPSTSPCHFSSRQGYHHTLHHVLLSTFSWSHSLCYSTVWYDINRFLKISFVIIRAFACCCSYIILPALYICAGCKKKKKNMLQPCPYSCSVTAWQSCLCMTEPTVTESTK